LPIERSLQHLSNSSHFREVSPENLSFALGLCGFDQIEWKLFEGERLGKDSLDWFEQRVRKYTENLQNQALKEGFILEMEKLKEMPEMLESRFSDFYVLHAVHFR